MKPIQVGLLGIGTVGAGTFSVLARNQQEIRRRAGRGIEITMVADLDTARARSVVGADVKVVNDARCPADALCIQAGDAVVALRVGKVLSAVYRAGEFQKSTGTPEGYGLRLLVEPSVSSLTSAEPVEATA